MVKKAIIFYSHGHVSPQIMDACMESIIEAVDGDPEIEIISVTQEPLSFGHNIVMPEMPHSHGSIYRQILSGLVNTNADQVFLAEHDVLYPHGYYDFELPNKLDFFYCPNIYYLTARGFLSGLGSTLLSTLTANRQILINCLLERLDYLAAEPLAKLTWIEPGIDDPVNRYNAVMRQDSNPVIDIRHSQNYTGSRGDELSDDKFTDEIPYWSELMWLRPYLKG